MEDAGYRPVTRRSDAILIGTAFAVFFLSVFFVTAGRALAVTLVVNIFLALFQSRPVEGWSRATWIIFASLAAIHMVLVLAIRIPDPSFGAAYTPFALVEGFILWFILKRVEKRFPNT